MATLKWILITIVGLLVCLLLIVFIRTLFFRSKKKTPYPKEKVTIDQEKAVLSLQALVRCKTVSYNDKKLENEEEFSKLKATLRVFFPTIFEKGDFLELSPRALLFHLEGQKKDLKPVVLMAHFDVVPANDSSWSVPPFEGLRKSGILYGRGTIDTKGTLNGILSATEQLLKEGFRAERDLYLAFAGDEETGGGSARLAVRYLKERGIEPLFVLDEGGAIVEGMFPGVQAPIALVGTAEKGACGLEFRVIGEGGHASAPKKPSPMGRLAKIAVILERHSFKIHFSAPVKEMFSTLGREASFLYRIVYANLWLFKPFLGMIASKKGGQFNALMRTTTALTMAEGSTVTNVIPSNAMLGVNMRLSAPDTIESVTPYFKKIAAKNQVDFQILSTYAWNPSRISTTSGEGFEKVQAAISSTWGEKVLVSPYLMTACSDARFYGEISDKVYRFSPMKLSKRQVEMIHGDDESLEEKQIGETVEFFYRLIKSL